MKRNIKICFIILVIIFLVIFLDTLQAKLFNNSPLLKIRKDYNGGILYCIDKGIFVDSYQYTSGKRCTVFKWNDYDYLNIENYNL